jgi:shikimate kinase
MRLIFLIGMPGAGKSYWGRIWARSAGFDFADLDEHIEAQAGVTIPYIFQSMGEDGFRALEASVLLDTIADARGRDTVVATGGGTPVFDCNMDVMLRSGCVVYLTAEIGTLVRQLEGTELSRPLLYHLDLNEDALAGMLEKRKVFYERAHVTVAVEKIGTDTFAQILEECTNRQS